MLHSVIAQSKLLPVVLFMFRIMRKNGLGRYLKDRKDGARKGKYWIEVSPGKGYTFDVI